MGPKHSPPLIKAMFLLCLDASGPRTSLVLSMRDNMSRQVQLQISHLWGDNALTKFSALVALLFHPL